MHYGDGSAFAPGSVVLTDFVAVPEPGAFAALLGGAALVALLLRRR